MKRTNLGNYRPIMDMIAKVSKENSVLYGNGTTGQTYEAHFWMREQTVSEALAKWEAEKAQAYLNGDVTKLAELKLSKPVGQQIKYNLCFRLINPIPLLAGTKRAYNLDNQPMIIPPLHNVQEIWISQDTIDYGAAEVEETDVVKKDFYGEEWKVLKITLTDGMLDIKEASKNGRGKITKAARAWIYPVSGRSMQLAGQILYRNRKLTDKYIPES